MPSLTAFSVLQRCYNVANFTLKTALEFEKWRFGIVNKQQHGLELIDAELSKYLSREAVKPDVGVSPRVCSCTCMQTQLNGFTDEAVLLYATPSSLRCSAQASEVAENRKGSQKFFPTATLRASRFLRAVSTRSTFPRRPLTVEPREADWRLLFVL